MVNSVGLLEVSTILGTFEGVLRRGNVTDTVVDTSSLKFPKSGVDVQEEVVDSDLFELKLKLTSRE